MTENRTSEQDEKIIALLAEFRKRERPPVEPVEYEGGQIIPLSRAEQATCGHSWANRINTENKWKYVCIFCGKSSRVQT